jgi:alpha-glucosidase
VPDGWGSLSVEAQSDDDGSMLALCRRALGIRAQLHRDGELSAGDEVVWERSPDGRLAGTRAGRFVFVLAMGNTAVPLPEGEVLLTSAPLSPEGDLPPDGAAWLRLPER